MNALLKFLSPMVSKKLLVGGVLGSAALASGEVDGWQFVALSLGYVVVQGAVDIAKAKAGVVDPRDRQAEDIPKPKE